MIKPVIGSALLLIIALTKVFPQQSFEKIRINTPIDQFLTDVNWGDYDQDGDLDILGIALLLTGSTYTSDITLLRNDGDGNFHSVALSPPLKYSKVAEWADFDNDNDLDFILVGCSSGCHMPKTYIMRNDGFDKFTSVEHNLGSAVNVKVADFNGDGLVDVAMNEFALSPQLYKNTGNFTFELAFEFPMESEDEIFWNDFNLDGKLDFARGKYLYKNNGNNQFSTIDLGLANSRYGAYVWADLDGDGDDDFMRYDLTYTTNPSTGKSVREDHIDMFENLGASTFLNKGRLNGVKSFETNGAGDFDGDGDIDLILSGTVDFSRTETWTHMMRNNGNWNFQREDLLEALRYRYPFVVGDYDNDQDPDILLSGGYINEVVLLRNNLTLQPQIPSVPANTHAVIAGNTLTLSWDAADDIESTSVKYNVYVKRDTLYFLTPHSDITTGRSHIPGFSNAGRSRTVSLDMSIWPEGYYTWGVQSVDGELNASPFSSRKEFTKYLSNGPLAPPNLRVTSVSNNTIQIQWDDVAADEVSYSIERSSKGNGVFVSIATLPANSTTFTDAGLLSNAEYFYRIKLSRAGTPALSNVVGGKTNAVLNEDPYSLQISQIESSSIQLEWLFDGTGHIGFIIQRSLDDRENFISVDSVSSGSLLFKDFGLEAQRNYFYRLVAYSDGGNSNYSNVAQASTPPHGFAEATITSLDFDFGQYNMSWGDYDNNGFEDLFVGHLTQLYRNKGDGSFERVEHNIKFGQMGSDVSSAWGDYDNDGLLDIFILNTREKKIFRNKGNGVFEEVICAITFDPSGLKIASWSDLDNDGDLEIVMGSYYYRYDGGAVFTKVTLPQVSNYHHTYNSSPGDFNNDGFTDLFIVNSGPDQLLLNDVDGKFTAVNSAVPEKTSYDPFGIWVDYNNDLQLDFSVGHKNRDYVFVNTGGELVESNALENFHKPINKNFYWEDYDNDGDQDFIFLGDYYEPNKILENIGNRPFVTNTSTGLSVNSREYNSISFFDFNNDGFRDVITLSHTHRVFKNIPNKNRWIKIKLVGSASNSKGVGAKIFLKAGGVWQRKDIVTSHSAYIQQGFEPIFGLRNALVVDSILVEWPAGSVQILKSVTPDQVLYIREVEAQVKPFYKPSNLHGTVIPKTSIQLFWKDNSSDEDGFVIQTSADGVAFTDMTDVEPNVQTFLVKNLTYGTTYYFRVMATKGGTRSLASNIYEDKLTLFENVNVGRITNVAFESSGVSWADFSGDGLQDLYVNSTSFEGDALYQNSGNGLFTKYLSLPPAIFNNSRSAAWGDYNNDGNQDLFLAVGGSSITVDEGMVDHLYKNQGVGIFEKVSNTVTANTFGSHTGAWGDLNQDGFLDLVVSTDRHTLKYMNLGGSSFSSSTTIGSQSASQLLVLSDVDNDKDLDVIQSNGYGGLQWVKNEGGELAKAVTLTHRSARGFCVEDFDNDGHLDILMVGSEGAVFFKYDPAISMYDVVSILPQGESGYVSCGAGDFDNNGYMDVLLTKATGGNEFYLYNGEEFVAHAGEDFDPINGIISISTADYNKDGFLDILMSSPHNGSTRHMFKANVSYNHWLRVKLVGKESNRDGLGAKIKLFNPNGPQIREIRSGSGSYSASEQIAHFGLGVANSVEYLKIEWPSGKNQWIRKPAIDSLLVIEEGDGVIPEISIAPPTQLTATMLPELEAAVEWTDNSNLETNYILQRSVNGSSFEIYKLLPANTVSFVDNFSAMDDNPYIIQYRVIAAFDEIYSDPSNIAELTLGVTGIESEPAISLSVYPNPAESSCLVESDTPMHNISLYDASGHCQKQEDVESVLMYEMSVVDLADGIYILKIRTSSSVIVKKIVVTSKP
jgi:hypothetical protein